MKTYAEKLRDPRWQKKRLEIFQRDGWKCVVTGATDKTLVVHHKRYVGENPWDTPNEDLETVCEEVHGLIYDACITLRKYCSNASVSAKDIYKIVDDAIRAIVRKEYGGNWEKAKRDIDALSWKTSLCVHCALIGKYGDKKHKNQKDKRKKKK